MSRYSDSTLMKNERVLYRAHLHVFAYTTPIIVLIIGLIMLQIIPLPDMQTIESQVDNEEVMRDIDVIKSGVENRAHSLKEMMAEQFEIILKVLPEEAKAAFRALSFFRLVYIGAALTAVSLIQILRVFIKRHTNEYIVTNHKVMYKFGFISVDSVEMNLDRIEGVQIKQGVIDRIVGRGNVLINGVGLDQIELKKLSNPSQFRLKVLEALDKFVNRK